MAVCPSCEARFDPIDDVDVVTGDVAETIGNQAVYLCPECDTILGYSQIGPF